MVNSLSVQTGNIVTNKNRIFTVPKGFGHSRRQV